MRRFIGAFEAYRRLGFKADDIFFLVSESARFGVLSAFCLLKTQGKEFATECGPVESQEKAAAEYAALAMDKLPEADLERLWDESEPRQNATLFVLAIVDKGFRIPNTVNSDLGLS
jgi:hypothetical protein